MTGIRLVILGPMRGWRDGAELDLGPPQQQGALGFLVLNAGKPVGMDELTDALWGDAIPRGAPGTIRTYIYKLRQTLGKEALQSSSSGYTLAARTARLDIEDFCRLADQARGLRTRGGQAIAAQRLEEAMSLWRGRPLSGVHGHYVHEHRGWLDELRLGVMEERFSIALELGRHAEVIAELTALVATEPFRERIREFFMLALYRAGRQADALASYRELRTLLRRDLGLDPGAALQQLQQRILRADPELLASPVASAHMAPTAIRPPARLNYRRISLEHSTVSRIHHVCDSNSCSAVAGR